MRPRIPITLLAAFTLTAAASAQSDSSPKAREAANPYLIVPCDKVLGLELQAAADKDIGEIGDLLLDAESGEIRYAVIEVGGFLGIGEKDRVVPWALIQVRRDREDAKEMRAHTSLTEEQVKRAPEHRSDPDFVRELDRRIEDVFGKADAWAHVGEGPAAIASVKQLEGAKVTGAGSKELGELKDVVLAPQNGCVAYLVLDTVEEVGDKDVAVPYSSIAIARTEDGVAVSSELDAARLRAAPPYEEGDSKKMCSPAWVAEVSEHFDCEPFWKTNRFASARRTKPENE